MTVSLELTDHPVLGRLTLGHAPMIDRQRQVTALRLTVFAAGAAPDAHALLALLDAAWPPEAGRLSLNVASEPLLAQLLGCQLPPHLMLELPAFMATDAAHAEAILTLERRGTTLLLKGRPLQPIPPSLLPCFAYSIIDVGDERRDGLPPPGGVARQIPHVQAGIATLAELEGAFARGAWAVLGWPVDDIVVPVADKARPLKTSVATVMELITRVDRDEPLDRLESVVRQDPTLAYRLLKYINAPIFGLRVEITSFSHALMMLGHRRLKRWLALLLVSGNADPGQRPLVYAAVRRGMLMEELGRDGGSDEAQRAELFVCGVFSLLDRLLQQPFDALLQTIPTSDVVREALLDNRGPFAPHLRLVRALEASALIDIREAADALLMSSASVNRALLRALVAARQLD